LVHPVRVLTLLVVCGAGVAAAFALTRERPPEKLVCCSDLYVGMPEYPAQITKRPTCSDLLAMPETTRLEIEAKREAIAKKLAECAPEDPEAGALRDEGNRLATSIGDK
jgi:hypothetical protein